MATKELQSRHFREMLAKESSGMRRTFTALSLFSGAGGMDIGVMQAGFEILACIEIDPYACEMLCCKDRINRDAVTDGCCRPIL